MTSGPWLPREHGFWTMLLAVQIATLLRVGPSWSYAAAVGVTTLLLCWAGGVASRLVRRSGALQVASSALLGMSGVPLELSSGRSLTEAVTTGFAWTVLFSASALLVRGAFARGRRRGAPPWRFELAAVAMTAFAALSCSAAGAVPEALALALSAALLVFLARARSTPRQLKRVGLALAGVTLLAGVVLVIAPSFASPPA